MAGTADYKTNGCVGFDFTHDRGEQMQSANANQVYGGHLSTCQVAVRCLGVGNVFHGQVIESGDVGYQFDLCPARKTMAQRGTVNDVVGCYTEHVRIPIEQKHADAFVTAQLTYVTGYERGLPGRVHPELRRAVIPLRPTATIPECLRPPGRCHHSPA